MERVKCALRCIDFGGFLGVGTRKIAVDWNALHFAPAGSKDDRITLELTRDQVKAAPEYKDGRPLVMLGTAGERAAVSILRVAPSSAGARCFAPPAFPAQPAGP